jgi:large subunit ribosomal protein L22
MAFKAVHRNVRMSARKIRPLANMVRGKFADEALNLLRYQPQRGARFLEKVIRSAVGNAQDPEQNEGRVISIEQLVITDARIDGGPTFKRIRPRARGTAFTILRRMSHITVQVEDISEL